MAVRMIQMGLITNKGQSTTVVVVLERKRKKGELSTCIMYVIGLE